MFTGLVAATGTARSTGEGRLRVNSPLGAELAEGDSVAVNGVCLTAVDVGPEGFSADVMPETLRRTSLNGAGEVNLELPLRASDRLGGHIVQGHVDGGQAHAVHRDRVALGLLGAVRGAHAQAPLPRALHGAGGGDESGEHLTTPAAVR